MNCTHESSIVEYDFKEFSILKCTWGCGEHLIELKLLNHEVKTLSISEILSLSEAREIVIELDAMSEKNHEPRSYEEASIAVYRMMSIGLEAIDMVQELEHKLAAATQAEIVGERE